MVLVVSCTHDLANNVKVHVAVGYLDVQSLVAWCDVSIKHTCCGQHSISMAYFAVPRFSSKRFDIEQGMLHGGMQACFSASQNLLGLLPPSIAFAANESHAARRAEVKL